MEKFKWKKLFENSKRILAIVLIACMTVGLVQGYRSVSAEISGAADSTITADVPTISQEPEQDKETLQSQETSQDGETPQGEEEVEEEVIMSSTDTKTIYFDTVGNGGWNGWTKDCTMYIYLMGVSDEIRSMTKSSKTNTLVSDSTGTLWEYTIGATELSKCTGIIFVNSASWGDGTNQTVDISMSVFADDAYPCFKLDGGNSGNNKTYTYLGSLKPKSYAGSIMYLYDMTGNLSSPGARFTGDGTANVYTNMTAVDGSDHLYQVTIPADEADMIYTTVEFCETADKSIVEPYNYTESSSVYTPAKNNVYYYGATQEDGKLYGTWGEKNTAKGALKGKQLYLDSLHFPTTEEISLQVGTEAAVSLAVEGTAYGYTFPETSAATQQTILTLIKEDGSKYRFFWEDLDKDEVTMKNSFAVVSKVYSGNTGGKTVYYDATLSKLHYATSGITPNGSNGAGDYGIPNSTNTIRYYATGTGKEVRTGTMTKVDSYTKGGNTFADVYSVDLPEGYTNIVFSSFEMKNATDYGGHGESTTTWAIPEDLTNPCFYGDTSDNTIYDGGVRGGYWAEVYTVRNPELRGTESKTVVDIPSGTEVRENNKLYVNTTFYDFYTDYELNGNNRDTYKTGLGNDHRIYQPFRQFDQALSDYYTAKNASSPLYWGNFQNYTGSPFYEIAWDLKLFGYDTSNNNSDLSHKFFYENNSMWGRNGIEIVNVGKNATQGLVSNTLSNGNLMIKTGSGVVEAPFLNESFLGGSNSKNTVLGKVYKNVSFPFTKKSMESNSVADLDGEVDYWVFDSKDATTNLRMKKDSSTGSYYLEESSDVVKGKTSSAITKDGNFFPFNGSAQSGDAGVLNYGFATKLEVNFRLTEDGQVINSEGNKAPIEFNFSGDDDIWIFVDGKLALDIGGGHGEVSGYLNFAGEGSTKKAYVSGVKDDSASNGWESKINEFTIDGANTDQHTLTMFYMERGIWESNMYVSFNFPDDNNLEVEKEVDDSDVNQELFGSIFDSVPMFPFTIKNLATHYGSKDATSGEEADPVVFNSTFASDKLSKASTDNTFEKVLLWQEQNNVVHYKAKYNDATGQYTSKRVGVIAPEESTTIDVSKVKEYLSFMYYFDGSEAPSLNHMYIELEDASGNTIGGYLNGKTFGTASMKAKKWSKVTIDLSKFTGSIQYDKLKNVKFAYDYEADFYLDEITFMASSTISKTEGFVTNQKDVADYGSATSGKLEYAEGAIYTIKSGSDVSGYQRIGSDGTFILANGQTATFNEQFRRGSYISLKEDIDTDVFETTYTIAENGVPVTTMADGSTIDFVSGANKNLVNVAGTAIEDGRIEISQEDKDDSTYKNAGYPETKKPDENTIVFRSFANPDSITGSTKIEITYINKVKTGSITITKEQAEDSEDLEGEYTFNITFSNVGGMGLEGDNKITKTVTLTVGRSETISGIPINTEYEIVEVTPEDESRLESVTEKNNKSFQLDADTNTVTGKLTAENTSFNYTFTNIKDTEKPLTNVTVTKLWKDAEGKDLIQNIKTSITVQLQRKAKGSTSAYAAVDGQQSVVIEPGYTNNWSYSFKDLDRYVDYKADPQVEWEYRVVELDGDGKAVEDGNYVDSYKVTYASKVLDNETKDTECTITNTYQSTNIAITKVDATDNTIKLSDVEFTLEKLNEAGEVDAAFTAVKKVTDSEGNATFSDLENGTYRITETEAKEGYSLLKSPMTVVINRDGTSTVDDKECTIESDTIAITVSNKKKFQLPFTGGYGRTIFMILGICFIIVSVVVYQMKRKNGTICLSIMRRRG